MCATSFDKTAFQILSSYFARVDTVSEVHSFLESVLHDHLLTQTFMPCPFILCRSKNLTAFSASSKTFVSAQETILLNANHLHICLAHFF